MEEFKYSNFCKFATEDLREALLLQIQAINSIISPSFHIETEAKGNP